MKILLLIAVAAAAAFAADEKGAPVAPAVKVASEPEAKVIPVELQMEYFRADGVLAHLKADLDKANADYDAAVNAIVKACGTDAAPTLTADKKKLFCVAQAPPPAAKK